MQIQTNYQYGFHDDHNSINKPKKGLSERVVSEISWYKNEPEWMLQFRQKALKIFAQKLLPQWGGNLNNIDFSNIYYYLKPVPQKKENWNDLPKDIRRTYERLGMPEAEKKFLAGVEFQYDSEMVYGAVKDLLSAKGVIFCDTDTALKKYPEFFKEYFGKIIPALDNKFAALNSAVWSGGSFLYVPPKVKVELPLQAYFRINARNVGQFERTLIIIDEGAEAHYAEGCSAPIYATDALHSAVVEIILKKGAKFQYTTVQNWSNDVYNLVTKRAVVNEEANMLWLDFNGGSKLTMKYPSCYLLGRKAHGEVQSIAVAGYGQHQDTGGKAIHVASETTSRITSKSISHHGGQTSYRGLVEVVKGAKNCKARVVCDALLIDKESRSDTYPTMKINEIANIEHEATVSKVGEAQLFYLMSRGLNKARAEALIVNGFLAPVVEKLPMEYALELNRLVELEMEGSVG